MYLYWDDDGDGSQSGVRETGIPSIMVWLEVDLDGDGTYTRVATTKTDADCRVVVDGSDPDLPQGAFRYPYIPSTPTAVTTTISGGNTYLDADFGYDPPGVIGDYVWRDLDRDGYQDEGEPGIGGVVVTVTDGSTYTTTTDLDGYCSFVDLSADDYTVWLDIPTGLAPTITDTDYIAANVGSAGMLSGTTQVSASVTIDSGGDVTSINGTRRAPAAPSTSTSASCWMAV